MTEQEIIAVAKTNWLAWQGVNELQPEVAAWMEAHKADMLYLSGEGWTKRLCHGVDPVASTTYRLRPDYEPPNVDIAAMRKSVADARDKWLAAGAEYRDLDEKLGKALEAQQ
jgi:hypothetical protein